MSPAPIASPPRTPKPDLILGWLFPLRPGCASGPEYSDEARARLKRRCWWYLATFFLATAGLFTGMVFLQSRVGLWWLAGTPATIGVFRDRSAFVLASLTLIPVMAGVVLDVIQRDLHRGQYEGHKRSFDERMGYDSRRLKRWAFSLLVGIASGFFLLGLRLYVRFDLAGVEDGRAGRFYSYSRVRRIEDRMTYPPARHSTSVIWFDDEFGIEISERQLFTPGTTEAEILRHVSRVSGVKIRTDLIGD